MNKCEDREQVEKYVLRNLKTIGKSVVYTKIESLQKETEIVTLFPIILDYLVEVLKEDGISCFVINDVVECQIYSKDFANIVANVQKDSIAKNNSKSTLKKERKLDCIDDYKDK